MTGLHYWAIAAGGALGSVMRFALHEWVSGYWGREFPWGTLAVNVLGSLVLGILVVILVERFAVDPIWRLALMVGLLGGFTTFSSFSLDAVYLLANGAYLRAFAYMAGSVVLCVAAAALGMLMARAALGSQ